jgi:adenylate kinase family enzyme
VVEVRAQRASTPLPDRVLVYGVTGSGKTTAAIDIGARTGLPVTLVDELTWLPGWIPVDKSVQREVIGEIVAGERWVLDSSYGDWLEFVLPRTQLVVGLDYPRWLSLARLVRRTVTRAITKEPMCNGNVETFRKAVARDSIIRWHFQSFTRKRRRMRAWAADPAMPPVLLLSRPRELEMWLESVAPAAEG